jgi:putative peptide zinc metalloprotease protein
MQLGPPPLPALRQDLRILPGAPLPSGAPGWVVFDPVRHRYFQIGRAVLELLGEWAPGSPSALAARMKARTGREPSGDEIESLRRFLVGHELAEAGQRGHELAGVAASRDHHWLGQLVHNYLFFRIPLVRPQAFLLRTRGVADVLFSPAMLALAALSGVLGLVLAARQWDRFAATGLQLLSLEGAFVFALCLPVVKTLHELGHAWMATRYGVRVPTMGVAFMVLAPFLYSEVTDAWRLPSRRQRLAIDSAGLLVELMLAAFGLLFWVFLPDGPVRTGVFVLATTSLVMGLLLNLNPFMRFDGYHILADAVGVPNLQTRSMAVGRWLLREILFGVGAPCPEPASRAAVLAMAVYAWAIWIYRFVLFLGIAVLVYHLAFKALGIVLFLIEIVWFILLPILSEVKRWWQGRAHLRSRRRAWVTFGLAGAALLLAFAPLPTRVAIPAVAGARGDFAVFAPQPARLVASAVSAGSMVRAGDVLFRLDSPDLRASLRREELKRDRVALRLDRIPANRADRSEVAVLQNELTATQRSIEGLTAQLADLVIRAPFDGRIRDLDPVLAPGLWLSQKAPLARLVGEGGWELRGYVAEADLRRLAPGAQGRFVPDDLLQPSLPARVEAISPTSVETIDILPLASTYEGPVAVAPESNRTLHPLAASYLAVLSLPPGTALGREVRGLALVRGEPESFAARLARQVLGVLIRESGA